MKSNPSVIRVTIPLAALVAVACSSGSSSHASDAPVLDPVTLPATFTVSGNKYTVQAAITYHDATAAVTTLHEKLPAYALDTEIALPAQSVDATIVVGFEASSAVPSGTQVEVDLSVIDADGHESSVQAQDAAVP